MDLIREWIEEDRLNASVVVPPSMPFYPSTRNAAEIKILLAETSEQPFMVEVVKVTAALDPLISLKAFVTEPGLSVTVV